MKFAGPSIGAALGSGFMQGMGNARDQIAQEELARDTSAMGVYSRLIQSGDWERVGKEGTKDGGVLRVGNVGFLKRVSRPQEGISLKDQIALSRLSIAKSAESRQERAAKKPTYKYIQYIKPDGDLGTKKVVVGEDVTFPPGSKPKYNMAALEAQVSKAQTSRDVGIIKNELSSAEKVVSDLSRLGEMYESSGLGGAKAEAYLEKYQKAKDRVGELREELNSFKSGGSVQRSRLPFSVRDESEGREDVSDQLPMEVPQEFLDKAEEHWLRNTYTKEAVDAYLKNYEVYQVYIKSGEINKRQILTGLEKLTKSGVSSQKSLPLPRK